MMVTIFLALLMLSALWMGVCMRPHSDRSRSAAAVTCMASSLLAGPPPARPLPPSMAISALAWDTCCFHGFDHLADVARGA